MKESSTKPAGRNSNVTNGAEGDAPSLVGLRLLMEEGVRRSSERSPVGRRTAIVILDGAVEAAIGVCLSNYGEDFGDRLDDGYSKLVAALRADGRLEGSLSCASDVKRLRKARNLAQHHGITPDSSEMQGWVKAVQSFVEHVVRATFHVDLSLITFADALQTEDLRSGFREAEALLAKGDVRGCVNELTHVFGNARRRSNAQHRATWDHRLLVPPFGQNPDLTAAYVEDLLSVSTFATDLAEYLWWRSISEAVRIAPQTAEVTEHEAQRAISFVFNWIVRWEGFTETYITDRLGRLPEKTPPTSPHSDGQPVLMSGPVTVRAEATNFGSQPGPTRFIAAVPFAAGSKEVSWPIWRQTLNTAFNKYREERSADPAWNLVLINDSGFFELEVTETSEMDFVRSSLGEVFALAARQLVESKVESLSHQAIMASTAPLIATAKDHRALDGWPIFSSVKVSRYAQAASPGNYVIEASFAPEFHSLAIRRHSRMGWDVSGIVGPGTFHPIGIYFNAEAAVDEAIAFADSCVRFLTDYRQLESQESAAIEAARQELELRLNRSAANVAENS